ncbi:MAG: ferric reductase-like transmembrane domain-containing protein [Paracoccus hibiscisoli]|uniref:ferredoxin reductase family protein n=1 Tax=Paracoccus hibiscisoli TaxID=2023261 RepID=UPI00391C4B6E
MDDTTRNAPHRHVRPGDHTAAVRLQAAGWLMVAAAGLVLPYLVILSGDPPRDPSLMRNLSYGLGFGALALAGLQFALTGRIKVLLRPFGADIIPVFHRFLSWGAVALMLGHFAILYLWHKDDMGVLNPLAAPAYMTAGRVALLCFVTLIVSSEFRKWLRLDYLWWRRLHVGLALTGFAAAIWHLMGAGHFTGQDGTRGLWLAVTVAWAGLIVHTRLIRPWRQSRNPWRVVENRDEGDDIRTLVLEPQGRPLRDWRPGQFAWLAVGGSPFSLREHPFTISTAPDKGPHISFSIKPLGDDSARLARTKPGTTAWIDGPYGVFTVDREADAGGFVMIAGGVGITPLMANLHALEARRDPRPVHLLYANDSWDEVAFRDELARMATRIDLHVTHVIQNPPDRNWPPQDHQVAEGRIDADLLARLLPAEARDWPHMMCGPAPMLEAIRPALRQMGVPLGRIHSEIFEMV